MPSCLIRQPAGLGDIFYIQKICEHYSRLGYKVYLPVTQYYYDVVKKYIISPNVNFCSENESFPMKELYYSSFMKPLKNKTGDLYIPLQYANYGHPEDVILYSKYKMANVSFEDWRDFFEINRDIKKENNLFNILQLSEEDKYIFVNDTFATPPDLHFREIKLSNDKKIVKMQLIKDYTIFDWLKVVEKAEEIHTVDTSICYLIEKLKLKNKKFLYTRNRPDRGFEYIKQIYTSDWEFIL